MWIRIASDKRKTVVGSLSHGPHPKYLEALIFCPTAAIRAKRDMECCPTSVMVYHFDAFLTALAACCSVSSFGQRVFNRPLIGRWNAPTPICKYPSLGVRLAAGTCCGIKG
jgi:hypothetical protein